MSSAKCALHNTLLFSLIDPYTDIPFTHLTPLTRSTGSLVARVANSMSV